MAAHAATTSINWIDTKAYAGRARMGPSLTDAARGWRAPGVPFVTRRYATARTGAAGLSRQDWPGGVMYHLRAFRGWITQRAIRKGNDPDSRRGWNLSTAILVAV